MHQIILSTKYIIYFKTFTKSIIIKVQIYIFLMVYIIAVCVCLGGGWRDVLKRGAELW